MIPKTLIYIAGPFRAPAPWQVETNIRRVEEIARQIFVWDLGVYPVVPHSQSRFLQGLTPDEVDLAGTLLLLRACDGLVVSEAWERSEGTKGEIRDARERGQPTFFWGGAVSELPRRLAFEEWLRDSFGAWDKVA